MFDRYESAAYLRAASPGLPAFLQLLSELAGEMKQHAEITILFISITYKIKKRKSENWAYAEIRPDLFRVLLFEIAK